MAVVPPLNIDLPTNKVLDDPGHVDDHNATNTAVNATADAVDALAEIAHSGDLADATDLDTSAAATGQMVAVTSVTSGRPSFDLVEPPSGGTVVLDANTTTKGISRILGGTADAPTVPWSAVTGKPTIPDSPDDIGAQPAGSYATTSALTSGLADKADTTALTSGLATKADTSALTSGLATKADKPAPVTMTPVGGVLTPNAALGYGPHRYDATGDVSLAAPTGGTNGQLIEVQVWAVGADRVLTAAGAPLTIPAGTPWWGHLSCVDATANDWLLDDSGGSGAGGSGAGGDPVDAQAVVTAGDTTQRIGVAAYYYPTLPSTGADNYWDRTVRYGGTVGIMVANPGDPGGPGVSVNSDYTTAIRKAQASGVKVLGYVSTRYASTQDATRTTAAANADTDTWLDFYPTIDGIFFDEATADTTNQPYYQTVHDHVKATLPAGQQLVVINPGNATDESYMTATDIVMDFEGDPTTYRAHTRPTWTRSYPSRRFWHIVHTVTSLTELDEMIALTRTKRAGYVQFHDVGMPFPYGVLPGDPFWSHQVAAISRGAAQHPVDLAGAVTIGGDNGLSPLRLRGRKTTTGAPTTGAYAVGDLVVDSVGTWYLCTTAGTPGTWSTSP